MCLTPSEPLPDTHTPAMRSSWHNKKRKSKTQPHLRILDPTRRRRFIREEKKMEMRNLRLLVENQNIIRENEALKKKALLLQQENNALFALLHTKLSPLSTSS